MMLVHERWLAGAVLRRQLEVRSTGVLRLERTLGPRGIALVAAGMATLIPGELICLFGAALLRESGQHVGAYAVLGAGLFVMVLSSVRFVQAARAGRMYRSGEPFSG
jgi:hypothetical protein